VLPQAGCSFQGRALSANDNGDPFEEVDVRNRVPHNADDPGDQSRGGFGADANGNDAHPSYLPSSVFGSRMAFEESENLRRQVVSSNGTSREFGLNKLLETHPERPFLANDDIENKGLLGREIAKKRLSG